VDAGANPRPELADAAASVVTVELPHRARVC
jgi:hypothetical protein